MPFTLALASALLSATPTATSPLEVLPSGHPVVEVSIDGSAPRRFVIDTAASTTTILPQLRKQMPGLIAKKDTQPLNGASGATAVEMSKIGRLAVDGRSFSNIDMILLPPSPVDGLGVDGILGADLIADFAVEMDMPGRRWRMTPQSDAKMLERLTASVPFVLDNARAPRLTIRLNGVEVPAVLDTGARGTILNWAAARAIGISPEAPGVVSASEVKGASSHATASVKTRLASLAMGTAVVTTPEVRIADLSVFQVIGFKTDQPAVILGIDMFANRRFVIDHPGGRLYIADPVAATPAG
ncbi:MAG TPA: retroviral-like aspartic protease family protein [Sphingomonas sp.]|jgi:predicted aspartyl protease|nr:retroviral-like aspartic protease family protein [Sphingomonas sp.]